ncbi:MAG: hypothetical protein ACK58L_19055 [Planctomycetota bacterium]
MADRSLQQFLITLSPEAAQSLVQFNGHGLFFNDVTTIPPEVARVASQPWCVEGRKVVLQ